MAESPARAAGPGPEEGRGEAVVRFWLDEEGWGVLDSSATPGGCWAHFSAVESDGYRRLAAGESVDLEWERPGFDQDGYDYRALRVWPRW